MPSSPDPTDARHLTWATLAKVLQTEAPIRLPIDGEPSLQILVGPNQSGLALLIPWSSDLALESPLVEIEISEREIDGQRYVSLGTSNRELYQECFTLFLDLADAIQIEKCPPAQALVERLETWKELLREVAIISKDAQVGALGELWAAWRLMETHGVSALDGWIGPLKEVHDFRLDQVDLEVKATTRRDRVHIVSDLLQLASIAPRKLFLLSLQLQPAGSGNGIGLPEAVDRVRRRLDKDSARLGALDEHVRRLGYREADRRLYRQRYCLRTRAALIPIDDSFPALSQSMIETALGSGRARRVISVQYHVDVEGLGSLDESKEFMAVLPPPARGDLF